MTIHYTTDSESKIEAFWEFILPQIKSTSPFF